MNGKEEEGNEMHVVSLRTTPTSAPLFEIPFILCPLVNLGNTCYFNAGVQLLANCIPFVYGLRNSPFRHPFLGPRALKSCRTGGKASQALFQAFAELLYDMEFARLGQGEALSPLKALDCLAAVHPAFEGRGQQDCPEMVNVLIANLSEEGRQNVELEALLRSFEEDALTRAASDAVLADVVMVGRDNIPNNVHTTVGMDVRSMSHENATGVLIKEETLKICNQPVMDKEENIEIPSSFLFAGKPAMLSFNFPGSWWNYNTFQLMQTVNHDNERLDRKERARKEKPQPNTFCPPKLHYNSVTDCFTGYMLSEVQCHTCNSTSRIAEEFSSLTIDVSSYSQRMHYARKHPEVRCSAEQRPFMQQKSRGPLQWWNPFVWIGALTRFFFSFFRGFSDYIDYPITLKECLDIHFEPVVLKGSNSYHCASCNNVSEATKREFLLSLPEYLLLQMKRFEYGTCFNTKKTDPVIFPVSWDIGEAGDTDVLQLGDYMHESVKRSMTPSVPCRSVISSDFCTNVTENMTNPMHTQHADSPKSEGMEGGAYTEMQSPIYTYTLENVVNHHGSIMGGHYTVYARKKTEDENVWLSLNDEEITRVGINEVADSEEYLLLYKKQPLQPRSEAVLRLRRKAQCLLSLPASDRDILRREESTDLQEDKKFTKGKRVVYISRPWLQRMAFMEEPGPILNRLCYGIEEDSNHKVNLRQDVQESQNRKCQMSHGPPVEWFYVPLRSDEYDAFYKMYGGNTALTQREYEELYEAQNQVALGKK
ncbi:ubiqitin hydrolase, putative [Trypanosoma cruzi marinkellei]|uniref:Ubiqitin hydrolase, putative n=1 Tax=Trypanosoma cruzi marinkellei TaxID=85056 RepID=K2MV31_TRYCR|nr:ubiqitin hydrolase, putative [Trypanosoma cruzi marinkellei]